MNIVHNIIAVENPRANGMVERYNGLIQSGFRKMLVNTPHGSWDTFLPDILAGLRFLPTSIGLSPFFMTYK